MAETRTYQGQTYQRSAPGEPWVLVGPAASGPAPIVIGRPDPTATARAQAEAQRAAAQAAAAQAEAPYAGTVAAAEANKANAQASQAMAEASQTAQEQAVAEDKRGRKSVSERMKYGNILDAIHAARAIAQRGGTGYSSLLSGLPGSDARALENALSPIKSNLAFDRLQEMRSDPDNKTGGALGSVSERELDLLSSGVASLDPGVKREQFLANLDRIERHFVGSQLALSGVDPYSDEGLQMMGQFGVTLPEQKMAQAGLDATTQGDPIPPAMQAEYKTLLDAWMQNPDPDLYAQMRADLDRKYGFEPDYAKYRNWANDVAIPGLAKGGVIGQSLPPTEKPLEGMDWLMNAATAEPTGIGAFAASMGNAGGFGIPTLLAGRDRVEALQGQSPTATFLGDMAGGITGAMSAGAIGSGVAKGLGVTGRVAEALTNPVVADVAYGAGYGATQAEDPVYGALAGAGGSFVGNRVGSAVAKELPGLVGMGGKIREIDAAVPSIDDLKGEAGRLYKAAEASGAAVDPPTTDTIYDNARSILAGEGQIRPDGTLGGAYPKVKDAHDMLAAYKGVEMTPVQVQAVRKSIADAAGSMDKSEARIGTKMLKDFDAQVHPFVPGLEDARATASKYLNAEQINEAIRLADPRAAQYSQSGLENALRTEFRKLDRNAVQGKGRYGDLVTNAIEDVSRGTPVSNTARWFGKFAPRGVVSTGASAGPAFYVGNSVGGPVAGAGLAGTVMGIGEVGKRTAEKLASRQATVAELLARGGEDYADELTGAITRASDRGGHIGTGMMAPAYDPIAELLLGFRDN